LLFECAAVWRSASAASAAGRFSFEDNPLVLANIQHATLSRMGTGHMGLALLRWRWLPAMHMPVLDADADVTYSIL
jgi:hypothetical protein